ncbi:MAG: type II toxin-antitoxin system RelE/ParE family toxin [Candidatus Pacebacteria bacterium]|nr:type II toxin-antitoxin system RelE/ParE family toxin [Candidatus Paceibacterota bacterium]
MKIFFKPSFIKDFKKIPVSIKREIRNICLVDFPALKNVYDFKEYPVKPIKGFKYYYRIRIGNYRLGFKKEGSEVIFMRIKHRKDIYTYFP